MPPSGEACGNASGDGFANAFGRQILKSHKAFRVPDPNPTRPSGVQLPAADDVFWSAAAGNHFPAMVSIGFVPGWSADERTRVELLHERPLSRDIRWRMPTPGGGAPPLTEW
jgi:hypothetical protein